VTLIENPPSVFGSGPLSRTPGHATAAVSRRLPGDLDAGIAGTLHAARGRREPACAPLASLRLCPFIRRAGKVGWIAHEWARALPKPHGKKAIRGRW
jgi:hypothetical protein